MNKTGIIMIVIGALALVLSYASDRFFSSGTVDYNWIQILSFLLIIAGLVAHILLNKKDGK